MNIDKPIERRHSEQGMALVMAIISLFLITGLATAMLASARTEMMIATNEERSVHARMAAEAGLNLGVQVAADYLVNWRTNFATAELAVTSLVDDGSLAVLGVAAPGVQTQLSASPRTTYDIRVYDDDDTAAARSITLATADITRILENSVVTTDANKRLVVHANGYGPAGTTTRLEAIVGPLMLPAVVTNSGLTIHGTVDVLGAYGSVHTNSNLTFTGGSADISQNCTASGTITGTTSGCDGMVGASRPSITVPNVWAADYTAQATRFLRDDGRIEQPDGTLICNAPCDNWTFTSGSPGTWAFDSPPTNGAYYVEGNVVISGSPGTDAVPVEVTLLAEGYVDISGSPDLAPFLPELFIVTNMDLEVTGTLDAIQVEGQVMVREQINIAGTIDFAGQLIAQDFSNSCTLVTSNSISGSVVITYNGFAGSSNFAVLSWREVR